jgi:hypothetical protein
MSPHLATMAAWHAFTDSMGSASGPSTFDAFKAAVMPIAEAAAQRPFVHGDPRVDVWEIYGSLRDGDRPPVDPPTGTEALAAWHFLAFHPNGHAVYERPLRRL